MNRIFIGFDPRQEIAYHTLQRSILATSTKPVAITPLVIEALPIKRMGLTPFTWSRFLVPWLCDYEGWGLFLDADILVNCDINEVFDFADDRHAVMAVKSEWKFEWASMMLFNCGHEDNKVLTPEFIDEPSTKGLHLLNWTEHVGDLPNVYNHLVLYHEPRSDAKIVHFTGGIPVFPETRGCEYTAEYIANAQALSSSMPWKDLMGHSVHVGRVRDAQKARESDSGGGGESASAD